MRTLGPHRVAAVFDKPKQSVVVHFVQVALLTSQANCFYKLSVLCIPVGMTCFLEWNRLTSLPS